jgi:hypothetical protein
MRSFAHVDLLLYGFFEQTSVGPADCAIYHSGGVISLRHDTGIDDRAALPVLFH